MRPLPLVPGREENKLQVAIVRFLFPDNQAPDEKKIGDSKTYGVCEVLLEFLCMARDFLVTPMAFINNKYIRL